jgi:hypothetical protein
MAGGERRIVSGVLPDICFLDATELAELIRARSFRREMWWRRTLRRWSA